MKALIFESKFVPSFPGYPDRVVLLDDAGVMLYHGSASCCPNPTKPGTQIPWDQVYGWVACGSYPAEVVVHHKHGLCVLLAGGREIPARLPNVNHGGRPVVSEVFFHAGDTATWRGSAGCLTAAPEVFAQIASRLVLGEPLRVVIIDYSGTGADTTRRTA